MAKKNHEADVNFIKELAVLLKEHDLTELEVARDYGENDNLNVRVARQILTNNEIIENRSKQDTIEVQTREVDESVKTTDISSLAGAIPSPMVGTFYRKPSPDKAPYVEVGQMVKKGDTVCIIEAMKMMNQVKSEFDGKIISINVGDGEPVEFGQELISIEES